MGFFIERDGLRFFQFDLLANQPGLIHGVSTRGVSPGASPAPGLNLALNGSDGPAGEARANLARLEKALALNPLVGARQTHGRRLLTVTGAAARRFRESGRPPWGYDALAASEAGVDLLVRLADCQGLILYEPARRVLALVHSGWRGSVRNIIGHTVAELARRYQARPGAMLAGLSPSLGPCCAEFKNYRRELPEPFWEFKDERDHFDFWAISRRQMLEAGLRAENIEIAGLCSKCHNDFFSYRGGDHQSRFGLMGGMR